MRSKSRLALSHIVVQSPTFPSIEVSLITMRQVRGANKSKLFEIIVSAVLESLG